jgi:hypothetical protein
MISGFFYDGGLIDLAATAGLVAYGFYRHGVNRHQLEEQTRAVEAPAGPELPRHADAPAWTGWTFNPPPGWPVPPVGWTPAPGWQPDPSWPPAPEGWHLWLPPAPPGRFWDAAGRGAPGERNSRYIPQDVKIAVSARDQGQCVCLGVPAAFRDMRLYRTDPL